MAIRFQALIAATAQVKSTSSFSENCGFTSAKRSSGTPPPMLVTASVHPGAARLPVREERRLPPGVQRFE